jgi:hypothetical protein
MPMHSILARVRIGLAALLCMVPHAQAAWSQTIGEAAELDRLRARAEEAIGNDDPDGAALSMGRAALMAKQLAKSHRDDAAAVRFYQGAEPLFRAQEHGYRAIALFRRAGGQLPASSGVCGSLALAHGSLQQALSLLVPDEQAPGDLQERTKKLRESADDWGTVVASMISDYQCS